MLLVDDDQADPAHRREHGRAGADHDPRLPAGDPVALVASLGVAERRVEDRDQVAEPVPEAPDGLRRERDLRHEHDRPEPALERGGAGLEVHLGLAAAGRPFEQDVLADPLVERGDDPLDRGALVRRSGRRAPPRRRRTRGTPATAARREASGDAARRARTRARASSRSSRRARARDRRAAPGSGRAACRRRRGRCPGGASTPTSATTPRVALRPSRTATTAPFATPRGRRR